MASRSPSRLRWSSNSGAGLGRGRHERPRHPHHDHDRHADQTAVGDQQAPKRRGAQGRIHFSGELNHPGRLVDHHHDEAEQHHAASERRQRLERLFHGRRCRCRHHGLPNASFSRLPIPRSCLRHEIFEPRNRKVRLADRRNLWPGHDSTRSAAAMRGWIAKNRTEVATPSGLDPVDRPLDPQGPGQSDADELGEVVEPANREAPYGPTVTRWMPTKSRCSLTLPSTSR